MYGRRWRFQQVFLWHGTCLHASKKAKLFFNQELIQYRSIRNKNIIKLRSHQQVEGKWVREPDMDILSKATEHSKLNILKYRQIGILEEFETTLKLFEKTIPEFYAGATEAYHGPCNVNLPFHFHQSIKTFKNS